MIDKLEKSDECKIILAIKIKVKLSPFKKVDFICFNGSPLKMTKNAFYFTLKALFVLEIFLSRLFSHVEKRFDKKAKVNFKIYDVTDWTTNS